MPLRIPLTVRRCPQTRPNDRVRFEYERRCVTPEDLVLRRWRDRSKRTESRFDGCRLPPGTWRVVHGCIELGLNQRQLTEVDALSAAVAKVRQQHRTWRAPHPTKLVAVLQFLIGRRVLERVMSVARDDASPGIPDLFLYRVSEGRGVHDGRFVEVKRKVRATGYTERVSAAQRREHDVLKSLGLHVTVTYLIE